jgi:hypothetical protein
MADAAEQPAPPRLVVSAGDAARAQVAGTLSPYARTRLSQLLIWKSILEALFVGALAVVFAYSVARPSYTGSLDAANANEVAGWAFDVRAPAGHVEVQVYIDGHFAAHGLADRRRADVVAAGHARDEAHGFVVRLPPLPPGTHEARVYAAHMSFGGRLVTLRQIDKTLSFDVPADEANAHVAQDWWQTAGER